LKKLILFLLFVIVSIGDTYAQTAVSSTVTPFDMFISGGTYFNKRDLTKGLNLQTIVRDNKWGLGVIIGYSEGCYSSNTDQYKTIGREFGGFISYLATKKNTSYTGFVANFGTKYMREEGRINKYSNTQSDWVGFIDLFLDFTNRKKNLYYSTTTLSTHYQKQFYSTISVFFGNSLLKQEAASRESFYIELRQKVKAFSLREILGTQASFLVFGFSLADNFSAEGKKNQVGMNIYTELYYYGTLASLQGGIIFPTGKDSKTSSAVNSITGSINLGQIIRLIL